MLFLSIVDERWTCDLSALRAKNSDPTATIVYGAVDMRRTTDGRYVFLEINPAGQWLFVEERTGQPMTDAFACLLTELAAVA